MVFYLEANGTASDDRVGITVILSFQYTFCAVSCLYTGAFHPYTSGLIHRQGESYESLDAIAATLKYNTARPHGTIKNSSKPQNQIRSKSVYISHAIFHARCVHKPGNKNNTFLNFFGTILFLSTCIQGNMTMVRKHTHE